VTGRLARNFGASTAGAYNGSTTLTVEPGWDLRFVASNTYLRASA
jgi:hypothetical protein